MARVVAEGMPHHITQRGNRSQRLNELTQKPPNSLNQRQIGSAFVVSSIFGLGFL